MRIALALGPGRRTTAKPDRVDLDQAERFAFTPSKIKVKQGELVEFVLTSDDTDHGFRIPGAGIDAAIPQQGKGECGSASSREEKGQFRSNVRGRAAPATI